MNEIRFSPAPHQEGPREVREERREDRGSNNRSEYPKSSSFFKNLLKVVGILVVLALIVGIVIFAKDKIPSYSKNPNAYSAVFLANGQVYFGMMTANNGKEIVLKDVYYLQVNEEGETPEAVNALSQTRFNLVKLGNELHGPTDELFVNKDQVLFYEYLRDDSKVVQSIKSQKQN